MNLVRNCADFISLLNARVFKQISVFLRELSNDNEYIKSLAIDNFAPIVEEPSILPMNADNIDFVANLIEFHFNITVQKEGNIGILSRLPFYAQKLQQILGDPNN